MFILTFAVIGFVFFYIRVVLWNIFLVILLIVLGILIGLGLALVWAFLKYNILKRPEGKHDDDMGLVFLIAGLYFSYEIFAYFGILSPLTFS